MALQRARRHRPTGALGHTASPPCTVSTTRAPSECSTAGCSTGGAESSWTRTPSPTCSPGDVGIDRERISIMPNAVDERLFDTPAAERRRRGVPGCDGGPLHAGEGAPVRAGGRRSRAAPGLDVTPRPARATARSSARSGGWRASSGSTARCASTVAARTSAEWLRACDAVVLPSVGRDSASSSPRRSRPAGPAVAFAVGGATEVIDHGGDRVAHPAGGRRRRWQQALERLARHPALRRRLGERGREIARERFAAEPVGAGLRELYEGLR